MLLFSPLVERAIELAAEWHDRTYRKSRWREHPYDPPPEAVLRIPVMAHLTAVALTVQRAGWDDETVAAAFLHDALEDDNQFAHTMTYAGLAALVGEAVAERVRGVTEPKRDPEGRPLPWRVRKETYLESLRAASAEAVAVSLAHLTGLDEGASATLSITADTITLGMVLNLLRALVRRRT